MNTFLMFVFKFYISFKILFPLDLIINGFYSEIAHVEAKVGDLRHRIYNTYSIISYLCNNQRHSYNSM